MVPQPCLLSTPLTQHGRHSDEHDRAEGGRGSMALGLRIDGLS
jgi:hypothetical protein